MPMPNEEEQSEGSATPFTEEPRQPRLLRRSLIALSIVGTTALLIVACGGGGGDTTTSAERAEALRVARGSGIAWSPGTIAIQANPGSKQSFPVSFVAGADTGAVEISGVPALQGLVSVTPTSFASLKQGETQTITVSVTTGSALGSYDGTITVRRGGATLAKPLPVKVAVVAPEIINGIAVPPEPPADLNNATLAGIDANGNGVRDDVERLNASKGSSPSQVSAALIVGAAYQRAVVGGLRTQAHADSYMLSIACAETSPSWTTRDIQIAVLNTAARTKAFRGNTSTFGGRAIDQSEDCK